MHAVQQRDGPNIRSLGTAAGNGRRHCCCMEWLSHTTEGMRGESVRFSGGQTSAVRSVPSFVYSPSSALLIGTCWSRDFSLWVSREETLLLRGKDRISMTIRQGIGSKQPVHCAAADVTAAATGIVGADNATSGKASQGVQFDLQIDSSGVSRSVRRIPHKYRHEYRQSAQSQLFQNV